MFLQAGAPRCDLVCVIETWDKWESFEFPGYHVFAVPRRIKRLKDGIAMLLALLFFASSGAERYYTDVPPETIAV